MTLKGRTKRQRTCLTLKVEPSKLGRPDKRQRRQPGRETKDLLNVEGRANRQRTYLMSKVEPTDKGPT